MPIKAGDDPDNECDVEPIATCGRDGACDGQGACRKYAAGVQCKPGSCSGSMETEAGTCSSGGTCQNGATKMCTGGHTCMNGSCASMCNADGECQNGFYCDGNKTCQVKKNAGAACGAKNQCASDFCVDGVCCNQACDQTCYACNLAASIGTCNPIPDGMEAGPTPECPAQDVGTCGRVGGCNGRGACRLFEVGTACGPQSCTNAVQSDVRRCSGVGSCDPAATHDCGAYVCSGNACATTCTTAAQCKTGYSCIASACRIVKITNLVVHDTAQAALWGIVDNFQIGMAAVHPWGDTMWKDTYVKSIDASGNFLLTKQWIKVAAESKKYAAGPQATITLAAASDVYLVVDDRWGTTPAWLSGWTNTGIHFQIWEVVSSKMFQFTLWKKTGATGMLDLPKIGANTAYDYFIIAD